MKKLSVIGYLLLAGGVFAQSPSPTATPVIVSKLTLAWVASPDPSVATYNVYASKAPVASPGGKFVNQIPFQVPSSVTTYTFANLADGTYYCAVTAANAAGVESVYSNIVAVTLQATPPAPPSGLRIVSQTATPQAQRTAKIEWTTSAPSTGKVLYWPSASQITQVARDTQLSTAHKVKLTGLKKNQSYAYQIFATAKNGSHVVSPTASLRIP